MISGGNTVPLAARAGLLSSSERQARSDQATLAIEEPKLEFDADIHAYWIGAERLPSVTQVLVETGLIDYSHVPPVALELARHRGTRVHQALQYLDDGDLDEASLDPEIAGYIDAYRRFRSETGFVCAQVERRVWNPTYRYAGTFDRTGVIGTSNVLLDFKTGAVLPGHALQLAAYAACLPEPRKWRRIALALHDDGKYQVHEFPSKDYSYDFLIFVSALACVRWRWKHTPPGGCRSV